MTDSDITRRRALALGGAAAGVVVGLGVGSCSFPGRGPRGPDAGKAPDAARGAELCVLGPSVSEGPYYLEGAPLRKDVTEGKKGVPLTVRLTVRDQPHACALLPDAAVEIWHCDAWGYYSGYTSLPPGGRAPFADSDTSGADPRTFLRGYQTTGADGVAEFTTVFPGWHGSRAPHIHVKVRTGGARTGRTYGGGRLNWTGRLYVPDRYADAVYATAPYTGHTGKRTPLAEDREYRGDGAPDGLMDVTGDVVRGLVATLTVGIDPTRESTGAGTGGETSLPPPGAAPPKGLPETPSPGPPPGGATPYTPPPDSAASASRTAAR
ncbi:intradiol ring-cleavage dioxygenase [Streptomyces sp. NPDC007264]|uniref:intradiol ring-cleavage dioxygenase n=1 Tax=Streptomyces sp. NPDC007264 TaxID=3364777 RepID=UPI0036DBE3AF